LCIEVRREMPACEIAWPRTTTSVSVPGGDLLDGNQLSVARTAVAHAGSVGFCRLTPPEDERATPIRRPRTVIVTDDGLGFAVAKCDVVDGHGGIPSVASMLFALFGCPKALQVTTETGVMSVRSAHV
jgi:hypothetical protein